MYRIAVCDDEEIFRKRLKGLLKEYLEKNDILFEIDEFESGKAFVNLGIGLLRYDIIFLDISMDEMDGMETARKIREINKEVFIVFVTAFINCALDGYSVGAVRYILKNNSNFSNLVFEAMDAIVEMDTNSVKRVEFPFIEGERKISLDRLLYVESKLHKLNFYIMGEDLRKEHMYGKLDDMERKL